VPRSNQPALNLASTEDTHDAVYHSLLDLLDRTSTILPSNVDEMANHSSHQAVQTTRAAFMKPDITS